MATKPIQRASVRLRIESGTALITNLGSGEFSCELAEISLSGCKCRIPLSGAAEDVVAAWKLILVQGRVMTLKFIAPPEFNGMAVPSAEIRWVSDENPAEMLFGVSFSGLSPELSLVLSMNLMTLASRKLRSKTADVTAPPLEESAPVEPIESAEPSPTEAVPEEPMAVEAAAVAPEPAPAQPPPLVRPPRPPSGSTLPRVGSKVAIAAPVARAKSSATMQAVSAKQFSTGRKQLPGRGVPRIPGKTAPPPEAPPARKPNDWSNSIASSLLMADSQ